MLPDGTPDIEGIKAAVANGCKVAYIQRSRGYSLRESLSIDKIGEIISAVKSVNNDAIIMVDNCYGEFVEKREPTEVGADLIIGSLIKNPGGAIARTGGYIAGRKDLVELCSYRLTTVGTGKEVGCSLDENISAVMGYTTGEIAALLHILPGTAWVRISRAREKMAQLLKED